MNSPFTESVVEEAAHLPELQEVLQGAFDRQRFLDLIRHFVVFEGGRRGIPGT